MKIFDNEKVFGSANINNDYTDKLFDSLMKKGEDMEDVVSIYKHNGLKVMLVTNEHTLDDVLAAFENVLKGSGFNYDGYIDIVEEE